MLSLAIVRDSHSARHQVRNLARLIGAILILLLATGSAEERIRIPEKRIGSEALFQIRRDAKWGFMDVAGQIVVMPAFQDVGEFFEGKAPVRRDNRWGFIDHTGKTAIPFQFDEAREFSDGFAAVRVGRKWGYVDHTGKIAITPRFQGAGSMVGHRAKVELWSRVTCKGENGPETYTNESAPEWLLLIKDDPDNGCNFIDRRYGFIDTQGTFVIDPQFLYASDFSEGRASFRSGNRFGFVDESGKTVAEAKYIEVQQFSENRAAVRVDLGWGYIEASGQSAVPPRFDFAGPFSEGFAAVRVRGRWGYINKSGLFVIPLQFESALPFSEGLAPIILSDGRGGYVDAQGLVRLLCGSCRPWRFIRDLAAVTFGDHVDYIDKSGKKVEAQTN